MPHPNQLAPYLVGVGQGQRVSADDADGRKADTDAGSAVVAVAQKDEFVDLIAITDDQWLALDSCQQPNLLTVAEAAAGVQTGQAGIEKRLKESEGVPILQGVVCGPDDPKDAVVGSPADGAGRNRGAGVASDERDQFDLPIEVTGGDGLADGRPTVQLLTEAMPRKFADEEHIRLAINRFELMRHFDSLRSTCFVTERSLRSGKELVSPRLPPITLAQ
jgi:hypothetical protein